MNMYGNIFHVQKDGAYRCEQNGRIKHKLSTKISHMLEETEYMKSLLPSHYTCIDKDYGINCQSPEGIDDAEHWYYITQAIKQHFKGRFQNLYNYSDNTNKKFDIYLLAIPKELVEVPPINDVF